MNIARAQVRKRSSFRFRTCAPTVRRLCAAALWYVFMFAAGQDCVSLAHAADAPAPRASAEPVQPAPHERQAGLAEATNLPARPSAPAEEVRPGVPVPALVPRPVKVEAAAASAVAAATREAVDKRGWVAHQASLDASLTSAIKTGGKARAATNIRQALALSVPALMLDQSCAIRALGAETLNRLSGNDDNVSFIEWLFASSPAMRQLAATLKPEDKADRVIEVWRDIWSAEKDSQTQFLGLAIAIAVVFDEPVFIDDAVYGKDAGAAPERETAVDPLARYQFYRDAERRGLLKARIGDMQPAELVWVVDAPVPASELVWAQKKMRLARVDWDKAYAMVQYRMDKASGRSSIYARYTLDEIFKEGGICGDQAYFGAVTAKANGIPAMIISGQGERGGHAWFGYEKTTKDWNLEAGRYSSDNYVSGTALDPQTRVTVNEHELLFLADPERRRKGWETSRRLLQLADALAAEAPLAQVALDLALEEAPRSFDAWRRRLDCIKAQSPSPEDWKRETQRARASFKAYPDLVAKINTMEIEGLEKFGSAKLAGEAAHRQTRRAEAKSPQRTDLVIESLDREVQLADQAGEKGTAKGLYRRALRDANGAMETFRQLATRYYEWSKQNGLAAEAIGDIEDGLRDITFDEADLFSAKNYLTVLALVEEQLREQSQTEHADRLAKRAERIEKKLDEMKKRNLAEKHR
jgi:hypothetical protein